MGAGGKWSSAAGAGCAAGISDDLSFRHKLVRADRDLVDMAVDGRKVIGMDYHNIAIAALSSVFYLSHIAGIHSFNRRALGRGYIYGWVLKNIAIGIFRIMEISGDHTGRYRPHQALAGDRAQSQLAVQFFAGHLFQIDDIAVYLLLLFFS